MAWAPPYSFPWPPTASRRYKRRPAPSFSSAVFPGLKFTAKAREVVGKLHTEEQAFALLRQGSEKGLNYFYATYDTALIYFSLRITKDEGAAEDVAAEAFVKLWQARETFTHPKAIKSYLYQVVRNASIDFVRTKRKEAAHLQNLVQLHPVSDQVLNAFEISAETHRLIYSSISNLPPRCGIVFRKFYLERKTLPQIAEEMGVSVNTVRNQKVQALAILRQALPVLCLLLSKMLLQ